MSDVTTIFNFVQKCRIQCLRKTKSMKWENAQRTYLGKIFSQYSLQLNLRLMKILEFRPWPGHGNNEFDEIDNAKTVHLQFL